MFWRMNAKAKCESCSRLEFWQPPKRKKNSARRKKNIERRRRLPDSVTKRRKNRRWDNRIGESCLRGLVLVLVYWLIRLPDDWEVLGSNPAFLLILFTRDMAIQFCWLSEHSYKMPQVCCQSSWHLKAKYSQESNKKVQLMESVLNFIRLVSYGVWKIKIPIPMSHLAFKSKHKKKGKQ